MSVIGGEDGPTAIFVAGKINPAFVTMGIVGGIILVALAVALWLKGR